MDAAEAERRQRFSQKLMAFFREREGQWIGTSELEKIGGQNAWRTRVSECRKHVEASGGVIENHQQTIRDDDGEPCGILSTYRYLSHTPLGRDAGTPVPRGWGDGAYQPSPDDFKLTP